MTARSTLPTRSLVLGLSCLLISPPAVRYAPAQTAPARLNIVLVHGDGLTNDVRRRAANDPAVRIEDEGRKPVAGAVVVFTLPADGASGEFLNHARTLTVTTDAAGNAVAKSLRPNDVPGKLPIHISASFRGVTTRGSMTQFNAELEGAKGGGHGKTIALLLALGGAAGAGAALALRKNSNSSAPSSGAPLPAAIGLTPGTGTVGAPH